MMNARVPIQNTNEEEGSEIFK